MALPGIPQARHLLSLALLAFSISGVSAAPTVVGYKLASKTISGRTTVDYTYRIKVQNTTPALSNVTASVTSNTAATVITDAIVSVGNLPQGSTTTSVDTFTLRQDRLTPFNANALVWTISGSVVVPNVVGLTQAAATTAITNAGLVLGTVTQQSSANVPAGNVISQNPAANASVAPGSSVNIVVSSGPANVTVPNVVGLTQAAATTAITNAGLVLGTVTQQSSANVPAGNVISQNPAANASVAPGSSVNIVVSSGPANVTVPNVVGLTQAAATTAITNAGLVLGTVTQQSSANVPAGNVISQNPAANASVAPGSSVKYFDSVRRPTFSTVQTWCGRPARDHAITNAGLVLGTVTQQSSANVPAGNVISQNPAANASVAPGSSVNIVVSSGPANVDGAERGRPDSGRRDHCNYQRGPRARYGDAAEQCERACGQRDQPEPGRERQRRPGQQRQYRGVERPGECDGAERGRPDSGRRDHCNYQRGPRARYGDRSRAVRTCLRAT